MHTNGSILIDDAGRPRPASSPGLEAELGQTEAEFDILAHAVRNLGYVAVVEAAGVVRVRLRPAFVSKPTLVALLTHLVARRPKRVAVSWLDQRWHDEVCGDVSQAVRRISEIVGIGQPRPRRGRFIAVRRGFGAIRHSPRHPLAPVLDRWLAGGCPDDFPGFLALYGLKDRAMIAERDGDSGAFRFRHSGHGIQIHGGAWSAHAIGRCLEDQPDPDYGRWIAEGCRAADDAYVGRHELVEATMLGPDRERRRWRYERLVLPWRAGGRRLVMTVSINPQRVGN